MYFSTLSNFFRGREPKGLFLFYLKKYELLTFLFDLLPEGKLLLEMNRILRPGGYFILSSKHDNVEEEEGMFDMFGKQLLCSTLYIFF